VFQLLYYCCNCIKYLSNSPFLFLIVEDETARAKQRPTLGATYNTIVKKNRLNKILMGLRLDILSLLHYTVYGHIWIMFSNALLLLVLNWGVQFSMLELVNINLECNQSNESLQMLSSRMYQPFVMGQLACECKERIIRNEQILIHGWASDWNHYNNTISIAQNVIVPIHSLLKLPAVSVFKRTLWM